MFKILLKCIDPISLPTGIAGVLLGWGAASFTGVFEILPATLCLLFVIFYQAAANVVHRYYVERYQPGGGKFAYISYEQGELEMPLQSLMREGAIALFIISGLFGMALMAMGGYWALGLGLLIVAMTYLNSCGSSPATRSPWGPLVCFVVFGPLCTFGTFYIQYAHATGYILTWQTGGPAILLSCVSGLLAVNGLLLYHLKVYDHSVREGIRTLVVFIGRRGSYTLIGVNFAMCAAICVLIVFGFMRTTLGWSLLAVPFSAFITMSFIIAKSMKATDEGYFRYQSAYNFTFLGLALVSFILMEIFGHKDLSHLHYF